MLLETSKNFPDFELLDSGEGFRLERWGQAVLSRPDPQAIWRKRLPAAAWETAHARFRPGRGEDKGKWEIKTSLPDPWLAAFKDTRFLLKLTPFKHTGLFAEQAAQWEWMLEIIQKRKAKNQKPKILNLFGYTGGATMVLAKAGCFVTHVDASRPAITWANENHKLNNLPENSVRWLLEDAGKFARRELKRGEKYDGIILDPPAFGHSPSGATWKFNEDLPGLLADCAALLSADAQFLLLNAYATNSSALAVNNLLEDALAGKDGKIEFGELCLRQSGQRLLSTGIFARWRG